MEKRQLTVLENLEMASFIWPVKHRRAQTLEQVFEPFPRLVDLFALKM